VCDSGSDIRSLQFIDASGCKRFLAGGRVTGCYFVIEDPKNGVPTVSRRRIRDRSVNPSSDWLSSSPSRSMPAILSQWQERCGNKSDVQLIVLG
jgi:hypothetical protein